MPRLALGELAPRQTPRGATPRDLAQGPSSYRILDPDRSANPFCTMLASQRGTAVFGVKRLGAAFESIMARFTMKVMLCRKMSQPRQRGRGAGSEASGAAAAGGSDQPTCAELP